MTDAPSPTPSPVFGSPVDHNLVEAVRQSLLQPPVFSYPSFQPVERTQVTTAAGVAANVAETSVKLTVPVPANTSAVLYLVALTSNATAAGTVLDIRHKPGGLAAGSIEAQVVGIANWQQIIAAPNNGQCTYVVTKNGSTSFTYTIYVVGFFRSY